MRQRRFKIVNALAAVAAICGASLVVTPTPALATPSVAWESSLDSVVTPSQLFGHADGKVTVAACGAPSGDAAQARAYTSTNAAGSARDVANNSDLQLYACTGQSTLGKDGTLYASGVLNGSSRLLAYKDGQLKWSTGLPASCSGIYSMTMGVNGNVYAVVGCSGSYRLVGYTPEVATGSTEPSAPLDVAINGYIVQGNVAAATTNERVYVVLAQCAWDNCGYNKKLYAIDFDGVDQSFPRGAVWKYDEPWLKYAALGDSYSSIEGVPPFDPVSDANGCHRSYGAYARLLDGSPELRLKLTSNPQGFAACSGAKTVDVINGMRGEPSQLTALTVNQPDLITITIGGNNIGFGEVVTSCILSLIECDGAPYLTAMSQARNSLPAELNTLFAQIKSIIGPQTRVLVLGYSQVVPEASVFTYATCPYLTGNEKTAARSLVTELNAKLSEAVDAINNVQIVRNFEFVDPTLLGSPFLTHEACLGERTFFNAVVLPPNHYYSFHPNRKGAEAYASVIASYMRSHPV